jgi:hypothetical protein
LFTFFDLLNAHNRHAHSISDLREWRWRNLIKRSEFNGGLGEKFPDCDGKLLRIAALSTVFDERDQQRVSLIRWGTSR